MKNKTIDSNHPKVQERTKGNRISTTAWCEESAFLWVCVNEFTRSGEQTKDFALLRFFYVGDNVEVLVDITARPMEAFLDAFINLKC